MSGIILLLLTPCGRAVQVDYYDSDLQKLLDVDQLVFRSSAIVAGKVRSVWTGGEGVPARRAPELLLDEIFASIDVENVVLGSVQPLPLRLCYFTYSMKNVGGYSGPALLRVEPRQRRIQAYTASRRAGRQKSAALLKQLIAIEHEPGLAAKACLVLPEQYYGQYDCLARLESNAGVPAKIHEELAKMKIERAGRNRRIKQRLRTYPLLAFEISPFSDSITGVRQELLTLSMIPIRS